MTNATPPSLTVETDADRLRLQLADAQTDLQRHTTALSKLQGEFMNSRLEVSDIRVKLQQARAHIDELRDHAASRDVHAASCEAEIARLHAAYEALNTILNTMRASRSWRFLAPARAVRGLLRHGD